MHDFVLLCVGTGIGMGRRYGRDLFLPKLFRLRNRFRGRFYLFQFTGPLLILILSLYKAVSERLVSVGAWPTGFVKNRKTVGWSRRTLQMHCQC